MGSYWGHVMPGLGTPKVKIQVIDLEEHLIATWRAQMQSAPSPLHFLRAGPYQVLYRHYDLKYTGEYATAQISQLTGVLGTAY